MGEIALTDMSDMLLTSYVIGALFFIRPIFKKMVKWIVVGKTLNREEIWYCSGLTLLALPLWPIIVFYKMIRWHFHRQEERPSTAGPSAGIWGGGSSPSKSEAARIRTLERELREACEYSARLELELELRDGVRDAAIEDTAPVA